ncbi:MAG TPA: DUF1553 domain-containing protein [Pirellulaceae bacterium]|nr:DUF1553 domain-containing protein [Pirellulaceae bacterium]
MRVFRAGLLLLGALAIAWCRSSAAYAQTGTTHWAYEMPLRPPIPVVDDSAWSENAMWPENAIDAFTHVQMTRHGLSPSPEIGRRALIRRVTLDLTGLPPSPAEIAEFLADTAPNAYQRLVDRLLQSPRFGERMATHWLDLARYADTHGYHMDAHRDMWRWRDWVIEAYNDNMPFDHFTIEQLAGDLIPNATLSQRIATGFNRNHMVNFENGAIADEFLAEYAIDRVTTTATVWLGQTLVCARCHDHKYDPITQRDFYRMLAFFDQVPENGVDGDKGNAVPFIDAPTPHQAAQISELSIRLTELANSSQKQFEAADAEISAWEATLQPRDTGSISADPQLIVEFEESSEDLAKAIHGNKIFVGGKFGDALLFDGTTHVDFGDRKAFDAGNSWTLAVWLFPTTRDSMVVVEQIGNDEDNPSFTIELNDGQILVRTSSPATTKQIQIASDANVALSKWQHLAVRYDGSQEATNVSLFINGQLVPIKKTDEAPSGNRDSKASFMIGSADAGRSFRGMLDDLRVFGKAVNDEEVAIIAGGNPVGDILAIARELRTKPQTDRLKRYYLYQYDGEYRQTHSDLEATARLLKQVKSLVPTTMVMQDVAERRPTHILKQGRYDSLGEVVEPGVLEILPPLPEGAIANRLALAQWLVKPDHPLTARVTVNHFWQLYFGAGFVRTPEDFGTRGEPPTHPELLDWLATEFASDWDVKRLIRLFVTSATYRQSHLSTAEREAIDPENRWLARASRLQLSAEIVRDSALCASGLLVEHTGGPSVFPYQPAGLWEEIAYNANDFTAQVYRQSHGAELYRRSLYTFVKRSLPSPTLAAFAAPNRETCVMFRPRTNTPQQALVLMNDVTFVEAARALAEQAFATDETIEGRINNLFLAATSRPASDAEHSIFEALLRDLRKRYEEQPALAAELIAAGESAHDDRVNQTDLAVWTVVANVILSLDETLTRP